MKLFTYVGVCLLLCINIVLSQDLPDNTATLNTTTDSNIVDTTSVPPAVIYSVNHKLGSMLVEDNVINFSEISTTNYFTTTEVISNKTPVTPLFTTLLGNSTNFSWMGASGNHNTLMLNNVNMSDFYSLNNYDAVSPEFANKIEILTGSQAAIMAGTAGIAINMQPSIFDTKKPYTRIWYAQGDNKLIGLDGIYSQNFSPNWNITAGFKRLTSNSFYQNSFFDMWNARVMLNYRLSNLSSVAFIYHFSNYNTGDFGGIHFEDYNKNDNSINQVRSNFSDLQDRQYKTDGIFTHSTTTADSSLTINSNLFWGHIENNIYFDEEAELLELDSTGRSTASATNYGGNTTIKYNISDAFIINSGLEIASNNISTSLFTKEYKGIGYSLFGSAKTQLKTTSTSSINVTFGGRLGYKYGKNIYAIGGNIDSKLSNIFNLFADISYLKTTPQPIFDFRNETHLLAIFGAKYKTTKSDISLSLYYRNINNPIVLAFNKEKIYSFTPSFVDIAEQNIIGVAGNLAVKLPFNFETKLLTSSYLDSDNSDNKYLYNLYVSCLLQYTYTKATSAVTLGVKAAISFNSNKLYYNPIFQHYTFSDLSNNIEHDGLSAYIIAKLGNCNLRASFKNILGANFSYLAYYPILKQEFCLSLTWAFPM